MSVEQREVHLFPPMHDVKLANHPYIVLSTKEANEYEGTFVAVMVTSSDVYHDDFSSDLRNEMFEDPLDKKNSHARMHLMTLCLAHEIIGKRITRMKPEYFKELMAAIGDLVF
jgi:hypothetical protein